MKPSKQDKSSIISGVVILAMAAVFTISLLVQALDFGAYGAVNPNFLYTLGKMLFSVYGFSSLLIPAFFLIAGLSCFASNWTARKAFRLLTAIVPFFTCVICENICRAAIYDGRSEFVGVKIAVVLITGTMLVVIEFVGAGIIADKINHKSPVKKIKTPKPTGDKTGTTIGKEKLNSLKEKFFKKKSKDADDENSFDEDEYEENFEDEYDIYEDDDADYDDTTQTEYPDDVGEYDIKYFVDEKSDDNANDKKEDEVKIYPAFQEGFDVYDVPNLAEIEPKKGSVYQDKLFDDDNEIRIPEEEILEDDDDKPAQPLISKEEYDALVTDEPEKEDLQEELEWNNLPPEQDELPPDYDPDYFEEPQEEFEEPSGEQIEYDEPTPEVDDFGMPTSELDDTPYPAEEEIDDGINDSIFDIGFDDAESGDSNNSEDDSQNDLEEDKKKTYKQFLMQGMTSDVTPDSPDTEPEKKTEKVNSVFSMASDVFNDMEADIKEEVKNQDPHFNTATNLTPDGMDDFFNAQNKANAPVTEEIEANLPSKKSHRAAKKGPYIVPSDLLTEYDDDQYWIIDDETKAASIDLKNTLAEFKIEAEIIGIKKGPVVTMFEMLPAPGVKLSKIVGLQDNIALRLAASSVRIVAPIPGKRAVGIEVPNRHRSIVSFRELIEQKLDEFKKMAIPVVLGKDILGKVQLLDLVKTPHLLIAGATGAGKSVCVNSIILSILYKRSPDKVKLILVDPKVVELKLYNDIPHLLTPVITEPKKAFQALQYCLCEMERRYSMLDNMGVRDISSYNARIKERHLAQDPLPYIVVIIDEFADLMATTGKELEQTVARLAAMSRAVGIHLVLATQRPSVNVITGLIKANIPSRIAFMVASRMDSSIIIDSIGAEKLLGRGDMLYTSAVDPNPVRIQGTFVSDEEVEAVVEYVKQYGEPEYIDDEIFIEDEDEQGELFGSDVDLGDDPLYDQALEIVVREGKASASFIQRKLKIGYNRAARLVEEMEERGIVGPANGSKPREVIHVP